MVGIVSYGTYIPRYRIKTGEIARVWQKESGEIVKSLGICEKSVAGVDEDAVTLAIEASHHALHGFESSNIEVLFVGSESHPYAVNPTSTIVGEFLGIGNNYLAADLQFACKAATSGMQAIAGLIQSGQVKYGMTIGTDTAQSKPHDALEYTSAAGAAAFILGSDRFPESPIIAELIDYTSFSSDTPDFWRRDGIKYPSHAGRFTGKPAYFTHVLGAAHRLLEKTRITPQKIAKCIFHMPNGKFPREVARQLGFTHEQLADSLIVDDIGNPYSASSLLGLARVLDSSKPDEFIFVVSYGSGAGSDAFLWKVTDKVVSRQSSVVRRKVTINEQINQKTYIDYTQYLKQTHKI